MTRPPKVLCGAPCAKMPVYGEFFDHFYGLQVPPGTPSPMRVVGGSIPKNLNCLVDTALRNDCTHLFVVEDDSSFASDTLLRLLAHDKPVVTGLCRARHFPFMPYIYGKPAPGTIGLPGFVLTAQHQGLIGPAEGVAATGMGGILINMDVFDRISRPYFTHHHELDAHGMEIEWGQDLVFAKKLVDAGVEVYCDLDVIIEHATQAVLKSKFEDGQWKTVVKIDKAEFAVNTNPVVE